MATVTTGVRNSSRQDPLANRMRVWRFMRDGCWRELQIARWWSEDMTGRTKHLTTAMNWRGKTGPHNLQKKLPQDLREGL